VEDRFLDREHADDLFATRTLEAELNLPAHLGKQSVVLADAHVSPRVNLSAALTNDDVAGRHYLAAVTLYAEPFRLRITAVPGTSARFLVCHVFLPVFAASYAAAMPVISISV